MRVLLAVLLGALVAVPAMAGPSIVGNFQGWAPDQGPELTLNANGVYEVTIAAGDSVHLYKAVDGDAWGQDFPGANQTFDPPAAQNVTFYVNLGATVGTKEGDEYVFDSLHPPIVCGDFMSELGGTDWDQTDQSTTVMSDGDGDDVWEFSSVIPAGNYNFKVVLNNNWSQDTYPPSNNYSFASDGTNPVTFYYHMADNTTEVFTSAPAVVISSSIDGDGTDPSKVKVKFSKAVEETSAETPGNYSIVGSSRASVVTATRDDSDNSLVHLELDSGLAEGSDYTVTVTGVVDTDMQPIDPTQNTACFYLHKVIFQVKMDLYDGGPFTTVHIQGDTPPLTWGQCEGAQLVDDGTGDDVASGDLMYTATEYFSTGYACGGAADTVDVKYKYIVDCTDWEGDFDFGHYVTLYPEDASYTLEVWWEDNAPGDYIGCDVGVKFTVDMTPALQTGVFDPLTDTLAVYGSESPLVWAWPPDAAAIMVDDGTGDDDVAGDDVYTATLTFPTGAYRFVGYKYALRTAESDTLPNGVLFECDTLPDRDLTLDDVDGCVAKRVGPMVLEDLWNWCSPVAGAAGTVQETSWGRIKNIFRP
jgi:hypothetical protein